MAGDTLFREKAPGIMALLMADFGLDAEGAAAILGNLGHESGGFRFLQEKQPMVPGSAGGYGWAQWTGPRRNAYEAYCERNGLDPASDKANYGWLWVELKGSEAKAIPAIKAAHGLDEKVKAFELAFERAGVKAYESRIAWANKALAAFHAAGDPAPASITPQPHDVLSPLPKIDPSTLAPIIQALLPVLLQLITSRTQQPAGQPGQQPDILSILLPLLTGGQQALPPPTPSPPAEVVVTTPSAKPKTSVAVGIGGFFASLGAMATGHLGTPLGMGTDPTVAGNLVPLAFGALAAIGSTGVLGPWGAVAGRVISAIGPALRPKT